MAAPLRIVEIAGSLRTKSFNGALLAAAAELAPPGVEVTVLDIGGLLLYDEDLEVGRPP